MGRAEAKKRQVRDRLETVRDAIRMGRAEAKKRDQWNNFINA